MSLNEYYEKNVRIVARNGKIFEGKVVDYCYPEENETEEESITIRCSKGPFPERLVEFPESDIKSIQII